MKHPRGKKKSHHHAKHKDGKAHGNANAELSASGTGSAGARAGGGSGSSGGGSSNGAVSTSPRASICEYCGGGGGGSANTAAGGDSDDACHTCGDDMDGYASSAIDINCVGSIVAFELRTPQLAAFFGQCAQLHAELHRSLRMAGTQPIFTESTLLALRAKLLALFPALFRASVQNDDAVEDPADEPTCPFVMMLSVLLPPLRKFLLWVGETKAQWWLALGAGQGLAAIQGTSANPALTLLSSQLVLHDILTQLVREGNRMSALMEENEEREQDVAYVAQAQQLLRAPVLTPRRTVSSSSSCSSLSVSSSSRPGSAKERGAQRLPQLRKISFEFEEVLAECKFELAELTEAATENAELVALRLARAGGAPAKDGAKARSATVTEYVQLLLEHLLSPLGQHVAKSPSASASYIFPRVVERCLNVTIEEFAADGKNEVAAAQFDKAVARLRDWSAQVETEYATCATGLGLGPSCPPLELLARDAFRRLDILLHSWLRSGKDGAEPGDPLVPRLAIKANLENLRSTFMRSVTARSGNATPPHQPLAQS